MRGVKTVRSRFRELLAAKAAREGRTISVRRACAEAGITWRIGYGMANNTITSFPKEDLQKLCDYFACDLSELLIIAED